MIASNQHAYPPIAPEHRNEPMLTLPDLYLDMMFGDLPAVSQEQAEPATPKQLTDQLVLDA